MGIALKHLRWCESCGCTDDTACLGGCCWVAERLCSACREIPRLKRPITAIEAWGLREIYLRAPSAALGALIRSLLVAHIRTGRITIERQRGSVASWWLTEKGRRFLNKNLGEGALARAKAQGAR